MTDRIRLDDLTSDQLDALYEQLEAAEKTEAQRQLAVAREALASATVRAARAEVAIIRVQDAAALHRQRLLSAAELHAVIDAALDQPEPPPRPERTEPSPGFLIPAGIYEPIMRVALGDVPPAFRGPNWKP